MAITLRSTPLRAQSSALASRYVSSQPATGIAAACLWLLSQGAAGLSTASSAARSRRWPLPTCWLAGFLLLVLALGPGAFAVALASVRSRSRCCWPAGLDHPSPPDSVGIVAAVIGVPARDGLLATASHTRSNRADPPNRLSAR